MKNISPKKGGFTLPEVLVSMTILVLVIFSATTLVVSIIRSNTENINTMVAYGLAQEGLEAVRNIRDSDWLLNGKFSGEIGKLNVQIWGANFTSQTENPEAQYYTVEYKEPDANITFNPSAAQLSAFTPWSLTNITALNQDDYGSLERTLIRKYDLNGEMQYLHSAGDPTPFHRYLMVTPVAYIQQEGAEPSSKFLKMKVSCVVNWLEYGRKKEVKLDTELTDWKTGI